MNLSMKEIGEPEPYLRKPGISKDSVKKKSHLVSNMALFQNYFKMFIQLQST